jgi:hypothetical protein
VYNARTTYVDQEASINIDAKQTGDAGKAIVWVDYTTHYYGDIPAKGGAESGATTATDTTVRIAGVVGYNTLHLQANNNITVANKTSMATDNSIHLGANNNIKVNSEVRTSSSGNITLIAGADADADDGDITIGTKATGNTTVNTVLTQARWLVYSGDPRNDTIGAFKPTADFKQYNTNYGGTFLDTGNGFVYRHAPVINSTLTGSASKVYDANANVSSIAGLTFNQGAAIDGDVVTLSGFTSTTCDNKNAATGKKLTHTR